MRFKTITSTSYLEPRDVPGQLRSMLCVLLHIRDVVLPAQVPEDSRLPEGRVRIAAPSQR